MVYIEFYFIRQVKVDIALSLPQDINSTQFVRRIKWTFVMKFVRLATTRVTSSIYMRVVYKELVKSDKK